MPYLFDSNCFLRLAEKNGQQGQVVLRAIRKLRAANETIHYTPQIIAEFWNVCTRPSYARGGLDLTTERTERKVAVIEKYFSLLEDNVATFIEWRRLVRELGICGVKVHDAKLVASMTVHNVPNLVTLDDKDFQRFPSITVVHPESI